jgi:colanic acid/amylovoran biosynthesis protein
MVRAACGKDRRKLVMGMNILITNSVPLNGGDEALLLALLGTLTRCLPGTNFTVLTSATKLARGILPNIALDDDLEHAMPEYARDALAAIAGQSGSFARRIAASAARRGVDFVSGHPGRRRILGLYRAADAIISAPGGYLHDYYPIEARLRGLETAIKMGKPVLLVGHSLGPFWKAESLTRVREILNSVTRIVVRERYTLEHLRACGVRQDHVSVAADVAFAWAYLAPDLFFGRARPARRIGLCFRRWPLRDTKSARRTRAKATALCRWLLHDPAVELVFTSTCQGIRGYVDDSLLAREIVAELPADIRSRCIVDQGRRPTREMIRFLSDLDACISMRMHVCILAMLGGTPAMALDYEQKSVGLYEMMELDAYHVDFRQHYAGWQDGVDRFLRDLPNLGATLDRRVARMAQSATNGVDSALRDANLVAS